MSDIEFNPEHEEMVNIIELVKQHQIIINEFKEKYPLIYKMLYGDDKPDFYPPSICNWPSNNAPRYASVPNVYLPSSIFTGYGIS